MTFKNSESVSSPEASGRKADDIGGAAEPVDGMSFGDMNKIVHELRVHQIELEMQNEELRRTQTELDMIRQRYFDLYEYAPVGYVTLNAAGLILQVNHTALSLLGVKSENLIGQLFFRYIDKGDRDIFYLLSRELVESGKTQSRELRVQRLDGTQFWAFLEGTASMDADGSRVFRIVIIDVSMYKDLNKKIQDSQRMLHGVVETAMDAIVTIDEEFRVVMFNSAAAQMFGVDAAQATGCLINQFIPERYRQAHNHYIHNFEHEGRTARSITNPGKVVGLRSNGQEFPVEATISQIEVAGKKLFTAILRDCTERKQMEDELHATQEKLRGLVKHQNRIREDERIRIAREIHDELGSLLTGIKANVSVELYEGAQVDVAPSQRLVDISDMADSAIETVRSVIADLRPSVLDHLGIWAALEWYIGQAQARSGIQCQFDIAPDVAELELDDECSIALFRILQESLNNVVAHARASQVRICVLRRGANIRMEVEDNGIGIDTDIVPERKSWGIIGMAERARSLGGTIKVVNLAPGTRIVVDLPLAALNKL